MFEIDTSRGTAVHVTMRGWVSGRDIEELTEQLTDLFLPVPEFGGLLIDTREITVLPDIVATKLAAILDQIGARAHVAAVLAEAGLPNAKLAVAANEAGRETHRVFRRLDEAEAWLIEVGREGLPDLMGSDNDRPQTDPGFAHG